MAEGQQIGEAYVRIRPKSDGFEADAQRQIEDPLKRIAKGAAAAFAGIAVAGFLRGGIDELGEAQKAAAQTTAALKSTGGQANVTADNIDTLATSLANLSGADKEAVQGGANLLLTFRNVRNEVGDGNDIYSQALTLAQDLSVAYGQDLQGSVIQLGKALDNPIQGVTALQRVGVTLSQQQKDQIKDFVAAGQVMEAQKVILAELTKQVGGSAAAFGETLPGKLQRAQNAFDDLKGEVVGGAAPALEGLLDLVRPIVDVFSALPAPVQTGVLAVGALALAAPKAAEGFKALGGVASSARDALDTLALKAMYAKDGLAGAQQAVAGFGSSLTLSNPILLASAAAITALAAVWVKSQSDAAAAEAAAKDYTAAIEDQTGAVEANVAAAARKRFADNSVGKILADTTANFDIFTKGIQENGDALNAWAENANASRLTGGTKNFEKSLRDAADGGNALAAELIRLRDAREISSSDLAKVVIQLEKESNAYDTGSDTASRHERVLGDVADAADGAASSTGGLTTETDKGTEASKRYADALKAQQDAALDLIGGDIAARDAARDTRKAIEELADIGKDGAEKVADAQERLSDAQADYAKVLADPKHTADQLADAQKKVADAEDDLRKARQDGAVSADDLAAAQDRVLEAMLREAKLAGDTAATQAEANGQSLTAAERAEVQKLKLIELADTLAPNSPLRAQLQGYIDQLGVVPTSIGTKAYLDLSQVEQQMVRLRELLNTDSAGGGFATRGGAADRGVDLSFLNGVDLSFLNQGGPKAAGGRVQAGTRYPVNEYGIEGLRTVDGTTYLTPGADGTVIPASQMPGGSQTWAPVFNITTTDPERATRTALRLMRREAAYTGGR